MIGIRAFALLSLLSSSVFGGSHHEKFHRRGQVASGTNASMLQEYDYVVVGSGPGGAPVASRLALAGHSVLLIEAGQDFTGDPAYEVPIMGFFASEYKDRRWSFFVNHFADLERQKKDPKMTYKLADGSHYVGLDPPSGAEPLGILYPRSSALGGCTATNALITVYPNNKDWTDIQTLTGDDSWEQSKMRAYYKKLEKCEYIPSDPTSHGYSGWLATTTTPLYLVAQDFKFLSLIISAASAIGKTVLSGLITTVTGLGNVLVNDINSATLGADSSLHQLYQIPLSMHAGRYHRSGPADFIKDTVSKARLDVMLNTFVTNITWDLSGDLPRATGVNFVQGTGVYGADERAKSGHTLGSIKATKEVIISTGTFNSPQLLKLSGVGPRAELESFGIDVISDLPGVGTNMQDRYEVGIAGQTKKDFALLKGCTFLQGNGDDPCYDKWKNEVLTGPYSTNGIALGIMQRSSVAEDDRADIFMNGFPGLFKGYRENYSTIAVAERNWWTWLVLKAHSRNNAGTVQLKSASPFDMPNITFNSFGVGGADDLTAVREGLAFGRRAFQDLIPIDGSFEEQWPGKNVTSDADLDEFATNESWGHHACCTNPIGADGDKMAVLDSKFRVRGTKSLRVVDGSVFPKIPGYYLSLPIYMISEKAADVILADA
ncbi:glucose-methanol-choline oxidoreductase-like protein [Clathrospora elynae]|uniref:Glucose-methanol-choline oxidoreductase-like protein n=1 Tax=Clathrospora elynae TaxID=706981 RepID=A0A6A5STR1_9PLEO|nr:glucose-methanol-choline oxidoreductase-like protein [Clathrospora elynae]